MGGVTGFHRGERALASRACFFAREKQCLDTSAVVRDFNPIREPV